MVDRFNILLASLLLLPLGATSAQELNTPKDVLAKAGDIYITEEEFLERFEMLPGLQRHRKTRLEEAKLELLYSLIAEKLMAQEARERKLDKDSVFLSSFDEVRKSLARDQLYREEISGKVQVDPKELALGIAQAQREILISFFYCDRKEDAEFLRRQIKKVSDFDRMETDTSLHAVRDTATVIWSGADPAVERAAHSLKKGEISPVIRAGTGYYILKVERTQRNAFYSSLQPSVLRERVLDKVRLRKEEVRLNQYVAEVLRNKTGYSRPGPLKELAKAVENAFSKSTGSDKRQLREEMVGQVRRECVSVLNDTLAVAGNVFWTVGDVIDRLYTNGFTLDSGSVARIPRLLNGQLRVWVQQELLAQEAIERGLDKYPTVRRQLDMWLDSYLAQFMKHHLKRQVKVSEAEVLSFMQSADMAIAIPRVQIQELKTATLDQMQQALQELQNGKSYEEVIVRWSSDPRLRQRKGISDPFPISERYPIGELAWQMIVGQRYGPVKDTTGFVYFELLSKESKPEPSDTAYTGRKERATKELLRQKENRLLNLFLAQVGGTRGYDIYQERLIRIAVSTTPMMTFRILGFGGRMFAVPFVDPQIEWLNIEPPAQKIVF